MMISQNLPHNIFLFHVDPFLSPSVPLINFSMFQLTFAIITPALISGALAERINFNAWMLFVCIWHLVVYCPLAHMMWSQDGILRKYGCIDFAGGTVVEMSSGYAALAGAYFLGPRYNPNHTPANIPFIMLGTALFWFGWLGFDAGSAVNAGPVACNAFATTNTAAAAGMLMWIFLDKMNGKSTSAVGVCNGIVVGLVAATPSSGYVTIGSSMCIGAIAVLICYAVGILFKQRVDVDDSLGKYFLQGFLSFLISRSHLLNCSRTQLLTYSIVYLLEGGPQPHACKTNIIFVLCLEF